MVRSFHATLLLAIVALICAVPAIAGSSSEYGEVTRFGGFDSSAYNSGHYGGTPTPGEFLDPTGFAVDSQDNVVYVADRTSTWESNPTSWRIQQFSPTGAVLGATTFTLPNGNFGDSAIAGLAVDHRGGRLYALVIGSPPASSPNHRTPVAQELLAWSTTPVSGGLVAAKASDGGELPQDPLAHETAGGPGTVGGVISSQSQLQPSSGTPLYGPQGIAVDRLETPGVEDNPVALEASDLLPEAGQGSPIPGNTIVQQVATQPQSGMGTGDLLASWSGASVSAQLGASWGPLGIFSNPDGTMTVLLDATNLTATDAYAVKLNPDLSAPVVLNGDALEPPILDLDQAPLWLDRSPVDSLAGVGISVLHGAGPEVAQLSTPVSSNADGLYAADIFSNEPIDYQVSATRGGPEYWTRGVAGEGYASNLGIRLLRPGTDGVISSPSGGTIVNTLGNVAAGRACNIEAPEAALAAGAHGTLWVLDRGSQSFEPGATGAGVGRQIIEFAPGGNGLCPQPSGTFTMTPSVGSSQPGDTTLTVPAGTEVTFDASSIERQGGKPFAYEWDLNGDAGDGPNQDGFEKVDEMQSPNYYWPPPDSCLHVFSPRPVCGAGADAERLWRLHDTSRHRNRHESRRPARPVHRHQPRRQPASWV